MFVIARRLRNEERIGGFGFLVVGNGIARSERIVLGSNRLWDGANPTWVLSTGPFSLTRINSCLEVSTMGQCQLARLSDSDLGKDTEPDARGLPLPLEAENPTFPTCGGDAE